jgi:predicted aspartyl protease
MSLPFNPHRGLILVDAELEGPGGTALLRLALDTGADTTLINVALLEAVGYDPALAPRRVQVTTGGGVESVALITVTRLKALGHEERVFSVFAHTLPPSAAMDGLLGLNFLRGRALYIDFLQGQISLT